MKIHSECVPCLIKRIIYESEECTSDKKLQVQATRNACKILSELYDPNVCSATIATRIHKVAYETLGNDDPYAKLKKKSNIVAQSLLPKVENFIKNSDESLKTSMIFSIIGNMMDFGIEGGSAHPNVLQDVFEKSYHEGLGYDDYPKLKKLLGKAKQVVLFTENCGEIVFDKLLCRELKKFNSRMVLTLVVKGEKILSDATIDEALDLKFEEVVDTILTTGGYAVGVDFTLISPELQYLLNHCDLIICKGMANYESFSETDYIPIAYLLRTKCKPISSSMNAPLDVNVIKVFQ